MTTTTTELPTELHDRIHHELVMMMASARRTLPRLVATTEVLWVEPDHEDWALRVNPRVGGLDEAGLRYTLARSMTELAVGPSLANRRGYRNAVGITAGTSVAAAISAAVGVTSHALTAMTFAAAVLCLLAGVVASWHHTCRVETLIRGAYRTPTPADRPGPTLGPENALTSIAGDESTTTR